jgi:hypothetical protein
MEMWLVAVVVEAVFIAYCLSAERVSLMFPPLLYVAKKTRPRIYWGLISWCCAGEVFLVAMTVRQLVLPST